jgi:nucleotide-binding universal stress UspA family protein
MPQMAEILVAVDGSDSSAEALRVGLDLARARGDSIVFVTAWRELRGDFGLPYETIVAPDVVDVERDWAKETLAAALAQASDAGVPADGVTRHGPPAHEIVTVARERGVRLIVMGSHGFGPVEGIVFGSVSHGVLRHAPCPVVVCPPPDRADSPS